MIRALEHGKSIVITTSEEFSHWINNHNFPASKIEVFDTLQSYYIEYKDIWWKDYLIYKIAGNK